MKYLKGFKESISYDISDFNDIKELYFEFRDEWGFEETPYGNKFKNTL